MRAIIDDLVEKGSICPACAETVIGAIAEYEQSLNQVEAYIEGEAPKRKRRRPKSETALYKKTVYLLETFDLLLADSYSALGRTSRANELLEDINGVCKEYKSRLDPRTGSLRGW